MANEAMKWALEQPLKAHEGKAVLMVLAFRADQAGYCYPGQTTLAEETGQSERTVRNHLAKLEQLGLIRRASRHRDNGSRTSDAYWLVGWRAEASPQSQPATVAGGEGQPAESAGDQPATNVSQPATIAGQPATVAALERSEERSEEREGRVRAREASPEPPAAFPEPPPDPTPEQRAEELMRSGRNVAFEVHRVRAKLRRLSADFASAHEAKLANWVHHSDAELERLWEASHPRHWQGTEREGKRRSWNFLDLLSGEILPRTASPTSVTAAAIRADLVRRGVLSA